MDLLQFKFTSSISCLLVVDDTTQDIILLHLANCLHRNILVDGPHDQSSRWSSDHDHHPQVYLHNPKQC